MKHEGEILQQLLRNRKIGVTKVAEKFEITRRAVYNYFESDTLSNKVKRRFLESFQIDVSQEIHRRSYPELSVSEMASEPAIEYLKSQNVSLEQKLVELKKLNSELTAINSEKDKRIASLENMLKMALQNKNE